MEDTLHYRLDRLAESDMYPFHMPGHKRRMEGALWREVCRTDITEIDGFDNLHHAEGILKREQERAARLYGSRRSFFLVNGASSGVLAAICAATGEGEKLLMMRGSHKSAYHAAGLKGLQPVYLLGRRTPFGDPPGPVTVCEVEEKLRESGARVVFLTSPTYEGMLSDISAIAKAVHDSGGILIVDEAHGAHLAFHSDFGRSAAESGADLVIHSLHKTMPAMTQTALLHVCSERVDEAHLARYLGIFQTSSPSYVLMASIADCIAFTEGKGRELFDAYARRLRDFYERTKGLKRLRVLTQDVAERVYGAKKDPSKIVIYAEHLRTKDGRAFRGPQLYALLRERYHLQPEMAAGDYVLAMTSVMDSQEGFDRLCAALFEMDAALVTEEGDTAPRTCGGEPIADGEQISGGYAAVGRGAACTDEEAAGHLPKQVMAIREAENAPYEYVAASRAAGRISRDYLYLYPPGTPLIVPGEIIDGALLQKVGKLAEAGLSLQGTQSGVWEKICVVKETV